MRTDTLLRASIGLAAFKTVAGIVVRQASVLDCGCLELHLNHKRRPSVLF